MCTSVKNFGTATFYLTSAKDSDGRWLDGEKSYQLNVPADVPIDKFWSVELYTVGTAGWLRGVSHTGRDSTEPDLQRNKDGSVDLYFGVEPPAGKKSNWIPTLAGQRFFLLFRFYGPTKGMFLKTWKLDDVVKN